MSPCPSLPSLAPHPITYYLPRHTHRSHLLHTPWLHTHKPCHTHHIHIHTHHVVLCISQSSQSTQTSPKASGASTSHHSCVLPCTMPTTLHMGPHVPIMFLPCRTQHDYTHHSLEAPYSQVPCHPGAHRWPPQAGTCPQPCFAQLLARAGQWLAAWWQPWPELSGG